MIPNRLKFFNVYGPNEYHKGDMRSIVNKVFYQIKDTGKARLFKSYSSQYPDGGQRRDFIYVKDAVDMTLFIGQNKIINGIFLVKNKYPTYPYDTAIITYSTVHTGPNNHDGGAHVGLIKI